MDKLLALAAAALVAVAWSASAQTVCNTHDNMMRALDLNFGETRRGIGVASPTAVYEIWASDKQPRTWTILKVYPNGRACLMASGEDWKTDEPELPGDPA